MRVDVAGVEVDRVTKKDAINKIEQLIDSGQPNYVVTVYSEFIVFADRNPAYKNILNNAALSLPDGIGIIWAAKYLRLEARSKLQALWQIVYSGASLILNPAYCRSVLPEQVIGSRLIWDIASLAERKNYSLALVGGFNKVAEATAQKLREQFPNLNIKLTLTPQSFDEALVGSIASSNSDILLVAYQAPRQETWLAENIDQLNVKLAMGLGGTFDYISGKRPTVPRLISSLGLEWLWRLITQPWRVKRIWNAVIVFIKIVYQYKLKQQNIS